MTSSDENPDEFGAVRHRITTEYNYKMWCFKAPNRPHQERKSGQLNISFRLQDLGGDRGKTSGWRNGHRHGRAHWGHGVQFSASPHCARKEGRDQQDTKVWLQT